MGRAKNLEKKDAAADKRMAKASRREKIMRDQQIRDGRLGRCARPVPDPNEYDQDDHLDF